MLLNWLGAEFYKGGQFVKKLLPVREMEINIKTRVDNLSPYRGHSYRNDLMFGGSATAIEFQCELSRNTLDFVRALVFGNGNAVTSGYAIPSTQKVRLFYEYRKGNQVAKEQTGAVPSGVLSKLSIKAAADSIPLVQVQLFFPSIVENSTENKPAFDDTFIYSKKLNVYYRPTSQTVPVTVEASRFELEYDCSLTPKTSVNNNNTNTFIRDFYLTEQTAMASVELIDFNKFNELYDAFKKHLAYDFAFAFDNIIFSLPDARIVDFTHVNGDLVYSLQLNSTGVQYSILTVN